MRTIGGYTLEAKLGEGGMGTVFKATHPRFPGRTFALKVLRSGGPPSAQALARFQREAEALARVAAHPNVVRLLGAGVERDQPYYVMEFVQGKSLADLVEERGPLEPLEAARVVACVTRAIAHAHRQGILHRDLKPENVLVDGERVLVCDFGLAKIAEEERLTQSGTLLGTPAYAAPEQLSVKGALDQRADVYGLGGILMFLLTGAPPFEATTLHEAMAAAFAAPVPPPSSRRKGISADMDAIVLRALAKLPAERYQSALELLEDLEKLGRGVPLERGGGKRGRRVALGVFFLALAVGASFVVPRLREGATGKGGGATGTTHEDLAAALAAVSSRSPAERAAKLLELGDALVAAGASLDLVGERGGGKAGLAVLDEAHRARVEGRAAADALSGLATRLARARLERDPADAAARELRALAALAARGAAVEALGRGRVVAEIDSTTAADLAAATTLAGPAGKRAAWLLVERHVCERHPDEARSALERASQAFPDAALAAAFGRILASEPAPATFASLRDRVKGEKAERVRAAAELARFLALEGALSAIEAPELAASSDDLTLDEALAFERGPLYVLPAPFTPDPPELARLHALLDDRPGWHDQTAMDATERLAAWKERVAREAPPLVTASLAAAPDNPFVWRDCRSAIVLGLAAIPLGILEAAHEPAGVQWLEVVFNGPERQVARTGLVTEVLSDELDRTGPDFDGDLARAVAENAPVRGAFESPSLRGRLDDLLAAAGALHRLELLESGDAGDAAALTLEALRGMEALGRVGGPSVLPFRARLRRLAFPGPLGEGLARLDGARAERVLVEARGEWFGAGNMALFAVACSAAASPPGPERDFGRELYELAVAWNHEDAVETAFVQGGSDLARRLTRLAGSLSEERPINRPYKEGVRRWYSEHDYEPTAEDETRVRGARYERRPVAAATGSFMARVKK